MAETRSIEFEIIKEPWNKYQLQDNSVLKTRTVLKDIRRRTENNQIEYFIDAQILTVVRVSPDLKGSVNSKPILNDEVIKNIDLDDMRYDSMAQDSNEYLLDDGTKIKMHTNITSISRSKLRDSHGDPIYSIQSSNQILVKPSKT